MIAMSGATADELAKLRMSVADIDLMVAPQANRRILDAVARRVGIAPEMVFSNIERYGNMSAATVPVALAEALESGRVAPGGRILLTAFGAGLTWCAHFVRWGTHTTPLGESSIELPPCDLTGLELVNKLRARRAKYAAAAQPFLEEAQPLLCTPYTSVTGEVRSVTARKRAGLRPRDPLHWESS